MYIDNGCKLDKRAQLYFESLGYNPPQIGVGAFHIKDHILVRQQRASARLSCLSQSCQASNHSIRLIDGGAWNGGGEQTEGIWAHIHSTIQRSMALVRACLEVFAATLTFCYAGSLRRLAGVDVLPAQSQQDHRLCRHSLYDVGVQRGSYGCAFVHIRSCFSHQLFHSGPAKANLAALTDRLRLDLGDGVDVEALLVAAHARILAPRAAAASAAAVSDDLVMYAKLLFLTNLPAAGSLDPVCIALLKSTGSRGDGDVRSAYLPDQLKIHETKLLKLEQRLGINQANSWTLDSPEFCTARLRMCLLKVDEWRAVVDSRVSLYQQAFQSVQHGQGPADPTIRPADRDGRCVSAAGVGPGCWTGR
jgi:hypothetical protein